MSFWCSIYSRSFRLPSSWQLLARGKFDLTLTNQVVTKCLNKWDFHILKFNFPWKHGMASLLTVVGPREIWLESQFIEVEAANMRLLHKISNQDYLFIPLMLMWCWCFQEQSQYQFFWGRDQKRYTIATAAPQCLKRIKQAVEFIHIIILSNFWRK